jgi:UDP-N-acetylmuramoyl-L-alanyl-D-glutamate--2,6-diaminopimelate ligase
VVSDGGRAVIWADDAWSERAIAAARARSLSVFSVGEAGRGYPPRLPQAGQLGQELEIEHQGKRHKVMLPLIGAYQAANALVAAGLVIATGGEAARCSMPWAGCSRCVAARARRDYRRRGAVYVDYAHTPDALAAAIEALRPPIITC